MLNLSNNMGNLVKDPIIRTTAKGVEFATFKLAVNPPKELQKDEKNYQTFFLDVSCFNPFVVRLMKQCKKGDLILLQTAVLRKIDIVETADEKTGECQTFQNIYVTADKVVKPMLPDMEEEEEEEEKPVVKKSAGRRGTSKK